MKINSIFLITFLFVCCTNSQKENIESKEDNKPDTVFGNIHIKYENELIEEVLFLPDNSEITHQIVYDTMGNILHNEGDFFSVALDVDSYHVNMLVNSINIPNLEKNFVLAGYPDEGMKYHLGQWHITSREQVIDYELPDSLIGEVKGLQFWILFFDKNKNEIKIEKYSDTYKVW